MSWKEQSITIIEAEIRRLKAEGLIGEGELTLAQKKLLKKTIDAAYPFKERKNKCYRDWLQARREILYYYGCLQPLR